MQFKHPELLYALVLLVIPIIVHLFQLRRFKKVAFTNVAFLKKITLQTRKSSQIKKWLILVTRLLMLAAIILAFAQPYKSKTNTFKTETETVIYLDNSFSMQAKGDNGSLLKRAIQDLINTIPNNQNISLFTNNSVYKNTTINDVKNDLLQLEYASYAFPIKTVFLKSEQLFSKQSNTLKNLICISDFQNNETDFTFKKSTDKNIYAIQLQPVNTSNTAIDSAYISKATASNSNLTVIIKHNGASIDNLPISLYNDGTLIAKTSTYLDKQEKVIFHIPSNEIINGKIVINDKHLQFDNTLYFNINKQEKINVLSINDANDNYLKRIYTETEFNYKAFRHNEINYNIINDQNLIILNEIKSISNSLVSVLKSFTDKGGKLIMIPSISGEINNYNTLLKNYSLELNDFIETEKHILSINFDHPLYSEGVFEKRVKNFQHPKVNSFFTLKSNTYSNILSYEDHKPFLTSANNIYLITSPLSHNNSNFKNSPLIVPTFFNIAKSSFKTPKLYYEIGKENNYEVKTNLQADGVLKLSNANSTIIPKQQTLNSKTRITTTDLPNISGIYSIKNNDQILKKISYNYNRKESELSYLNLDEINGIKASNSITKTFDTLKSDTKINELWKWFVTFAVLLLILEMLILKYFK